MKVNEIISRRRKELGLTLEEVAIKVGVSRSTVKNGKQAPSKICVAIKWPSWPRP